ncbi:MAG: DUF2190 family protein [Burkholderiaceae bacterium]
MATNPAVPYWDPADTITCIAKAAVVGKRFVVIDGTTNADGNPSVSSKASTATNAVFGVSGYDAPKDAPVSVYCRGQVMPVTAAVALSAGDLVFSAADGKATNVAVPDGRAAAIVIRDAAANADTPVRLL